MHNSQKNNITSIQVCQPLPEQIAKLIRSLTETSTDLYRNGRLQEWLGVDSLRNIIKQGQSCIVVGNERAGKGCAATLCKDGSDDSLIIMPSPVDTNEIFAQLWYWLDKPIPSIIRPNNISSEIVPFLCPKCKLECRFKGTILWDEPDRARWVLGDMTGKCLMKRQLVFNNLSKLRGKTVILRIPDLDNDLIILLGKLLESTTLIILATPEQKKKLDKDYRFRRLLSLLFPRATDDLLSRILASRVADTGMNGSPFSPEVVMLASTLSQRITGNFTQILARILIQAELEGRTQAIDTEYTLRVIAESLDEKAMVLVTLSEFRGYIRPGELSVIIEERFGVRINPRRIGDLLRSLKYNFHRSNRGNEYLITEPTPLLLSEGSLKDTSEVVKDESQENFLDF